MNVSDFRMAWTRPLRVVKPTFWVPHIPFAFSLAGMLQPSVFVELGTHSGNSFCAFCQAVDVLGLPTRCYAVDTWKGDEHAGHCGEEVFAELSHYHATFYARFSRLLKMTFNDALELFPDSTVDLLHVDGTHFYESVKDDFESWLPKMSDRGVILFHESTVKHAGFGAWRLIQEIRDRFPVFEFLHSGGLAVVRVGTEIESSSLQAMFGADEVTTEALRQIFSKLGDAILRDRELERLSAQVQDRPPPMAQRISKLLTSQGLVRSLLRRGAAMLRREETREENKTVERIATKLAASSLFDAENYLDRYPDVRKLRIDPHVHFAKHGLMEGRVPWTTDEALHFLRGASVAGDYSVCSDHTANYRGNQQPVKSFATQTMALYSSTQGNFFFADIRDYLGAGLLDCGLQVECGDELGPVLESNAHHLFLSPHEFFILGEGRRWRQLSLIADSFMLSSEQPTTPWFSKSLHFLWRCRTVFDINYHSVFILRDLGINAHFLPLGYLPGHQWFRARSMGSIALSTGLSPLAPDLPGYVDEPLEQRPIDLLFVGEMTRRRELFFAANAGRLSKYHTFIFLPTHLQPWERTANPAMSTSETAALSRRAKILLNIHRGEFPYFEWHRMVLLGFAQRTLVVTESCLPIPCFQSGTHYIEADLEGLTERLQWLLEDPEGKHMAQVVAQNAYETFRTKYTWPAGLEGLFSTALGEAARST